MVRKELSVDQRNAILELHDRGFTHRGIVAELNIPKTTVRNVIVKSTEVPKPSLRGKHRALSVSDERYIKLLSIRDRRKTVPVITQEFNSMRENKVSQSTIRRSLIRSGLRGRVAAKKPLLRSFNIKRRLNWALDHVHWTPEQWSNVLFTDESKFELFGGRRRIYIRRFVGERYRSECLYPTMKHGGGSVMVWGGISSKGPTKLKRIEGIMNKEYYHRLLFTHAIPEGLRLLGRGFVFQEDNDPKHSSNLCRNYLNKREEKGI